MNDYSLTFAYENTPKIVYERLTHERAHYSRENDKTEDNLAQLVCAVTTFEDSKWSKNGGPRYYFNTHQFLRDYSHLDFASMFNQLMISAKIDHTKGEKHRIAAILKEYHKRHADIARLNAELDRFTITCQGDLIMGTVPWGVYPGGCRQPA